MCGIAGIWTANHASDADAFGLMVDTLAPRGPDEREIKALDDGRLLLGHRRLSIIDLSPAGNQPMSNEDGSIWLTCNGEIYNYRELRRDLKLAGHRFRSDSDSETIVHGYEEWGVNCVSKLRGIFAFAVFDSRERSLFLARDHVGVKPLYYHASANRFIFASLPRAILLAPGFRRRVDEEAFGLYLGYGNVPGHKCIYQEIEKLRPGHWLLRKDGGLEIRRYWQLKHRPTIHDLVEAESLVRSKVESAVDIQSVSDVPVGALLSGGIDSTIITSILVRHGFSGLPSFNIGFDEESSDESAHAALVAKHLATDHRSQRLTYRSACEAVSGITDAFDEPFDFNGVFPYYRLAEFVRSHGVKVAFGGDGADEVFGGYLWYEAFQREVSRRSWFRRFPILNRVPLSILGNQVDAARLFFRYNGFFDDQAQVRFFNFESDIRKRGVYRLLDEHWDPTIPTVLAAQFFDFNCFLVDHCLTKVDRTSMAHGLEVRVPFLDVDLVDSVFSIDHSLVFHEGHRKGLLKRAMAGHLPPGMDVNRKKGFSSPIGPWLANGLSALGKPLVVDGALSAFQLIDKDRVLKTYRRMAPRMQLALISAELWCRRWMHDDHESARLLCSALLQRQRIAERKGGLH